MDVKIVLHEVQISTGRFGYGYLCMCGRAEADTINKGNQK